MVVTGRRRRRQTCSLRGIEPNNLRFLGPESCVVRERDALGEGVGAADPRSGARRASQRHSV
jgi:hypothetical protein